MSFAVVLEGMTLIAYLLIMLGGKQKRQQGWKVLSGCLVLVGAVQCAGMAIIVSLTPFRFVTEAVSDGKGEVEVEVEVRIWADCPCKGLFIRQR